MNTFIICLVYISFFALIGFAVYYTESGAPLWALLLIPSISIKSKKDKTDVQ